VVAPANREFANTRTVAVGTVWNLLGRAAPLVVAVLATPALVHALGDSRWGVFTIALSLIGIFGIFDFGLGRALTRTIAERLAAGEAAKAASAVMTGAIVLTGLGVAGAAIAAGSARYWVLNGLHTEPGLQTEVLVALYILCASAPLVLLNAAMWGVIAAYQQFRVANLINIPIMMMYYLGPLGLLYVWDNLAGVMLVLLACRLAMTLGYGAVCLRQMPGLLRARPDLGDLRLLLRTGGWMTISNLAFPALMLATMRRPST
jgi:O-antigen/teichoic acid export membrane protein